MKVMATKAQAIVRHETCITDMSANQGIRESPDDLVALVRVQ